METLSCGLPVGSLDGKIDRRLRVDNLRGLSRSTAEILAELPKLSHEDRRRLLDRILEIEDEAAALDALRRMADEKFQMLDAMEAEDAASQSR